MAANETEAVRRELIDWSFSQEPERFELAYLIADNLELDDPPLPVLAAQVERLRILVMGA